MHIDPMDKTTVLRPHHLLCLRLFEGRGYDERFTARMREVHTLMTASPETRFVLAAGADCLCAACPNRTEHQTCALGEEDARMRDNNALAALGARVGEEYSFAEVLGRIRGKMTEAAFASVCGGCGWHETGVCSYGKLRSKAEMR